ncbi:5'-nucleotidase surE [Aedoeadaptatus ivorii]|uniref:5'-nucleotidase SurE n=1 Tax=Aedoeadaptatus ivorii TaxID=54006 RepID=A0A448UZB3_9FIRM|nr:5'/3'-nucleotidase SurE [Peptoniphilus ivorii]MDQ0508471.1 5'-nucleotidase [Peptoniphilus ivorii]VEJ34237.1 5'-nucleotidase surE [Peptoniphilus ivorii]
MKILLTNDDGYFAPGIRALAKVLEKDHDVIVVAPETEHSGQSHAITINRALVVKEVELEGVQSKAYSVSGTPADCVRAGVDKIVPERPDVIFSGCNLGYNAGMDIIYSGTVSAALEGSLLGIPSVAVSARWVEGDARYDAAAKIAKEIFDKVEDAFMHYPEPMVLNINVPYLPYEEIKGIQVAEIGDNAYDYYFEEEVEGVRRLSLRGRAKTDHAAGTDRYYLERNYATLTPLVYGMADPHQILRLKSWFDEA